MEFQRYKTQFGKIRNQYERKNPFDPGAAWAVADRVCEQVGYFASIFVEYLHGAYQSHE